MGVDYQVWVIPAERTFQPEVDQVANLASALRDRGWVPMPDAEGQSSEILELSPGGDAAHKKPARVHSFTTDRFTAEWIERHSQHELVLNWAINDQKSAGVAYPFSFDPFPNSGPPYFYVHLILGRDFFYYTGETVTPLDEEATRCDCGEQLAFRTGWAHGAPAGRILSNCPKCGKAFDPSANACEMLDGWTGAPSPLLGGLTFHFALVVDCHKYFPKEEEPRDDFVCGRSFLTYGVCTSVYRLNK